MEAKKYLGQIKELDTKIKYKKILLESLDKSAPPAAEKKKLKREINKDLLRYYKLRNEILDTIYQLEKPEHIDIIYAKWVDGISLERIARTTNYSFHTVRNSYWKAMRSIEEIIKDEGKPQQKI